MKKIKTLTNLTIGEDCIITQKQYDEIASKLNNGKDYCVAMDYEDFNQLLELMIEFDCSSDSSDITFEELLKIGIKSKNEDNFEELIFERFDILKTDKDGYMKLSDGSIFEIRKPKK